MKENIPDFQTLMLPLMELLRDNKEHPLPGSIGCYGEQVRFNRRRIENNGLKWTANTI